MLDAALVQLTGIGDAAAAWRALFGPGEQVGIKVNTISRYTTTPQVAYAVAQRLIEAGLPAEQIVIFDRVESTDASYTKRFLLHGSGAFSQVGAAWQTDHGLGRMFVTPLLPAGAEVTQVGGAGREWEIGGTNYEPTRGVEFAGTHRLEISPPSAATFDTFLHVLEVVDQTTTTATPATPMQVTGATGALVRDWLVWFGTEGPISGLSFNVDAGPLHVVVGDLQPATAYDIQTNTDTATVVSDENGVVYFRDPSTGQHSVTVGEGTCPDIDRDGHLDAACGGTDCDDSDPTRDVDCGADGGPADGRSGGDSAAAPGDTDRPRALMGGCGCAGGAGSALWVLVWVALIRRRL
jgi:hypothetical protein